MLRGRRERQDAARAEAKREERDETPLPVPTEPGVAYGSHPACRGCGIPLAAHHERAVGICTSCLQTATMKVTSIPRPRYGSDLAIGLVNETPPEPFDLR